MNKKIKIKILAALLRSGRGRFKNSYSSFERTGAKSVNLTKNAIVRLRNRLQKIKKQRFENSIHEFFLQETLENPKRRSFRMKRR